MRWWDSMALDLILSLQEYRSQCINPLTNWFADSFLLSWYVAKQRPRWPLSTSLLFIIENNGNLSISANSSVASSGQFIVSARHVILLHREQTLSWIGAEFRHTAFAWYGLLSSTFSSAEGKQGGNHRNYTMQGNQQLFLLAICMVLNGALFPFKVLISWVSELGRKLFWKTTNVQSA